MAASTEASPRVGWVLDAIAAHPKPKQKDLITAAAGEGVEILSIDEADMMVAGLGLAGE